MKLKQNVSGLISLINSNKSSLKYRRALTSNIKFQADRIFVRNDLFEQVIKSCKATNTEFLMFKEKVGICLYEESYSEEEIVQDEEPIEEISKVSNEKSTKKSTKELIEESDKEPIEVIDRVSNDESNKELAKKMCEVLNRYDDSNKEQTKCSKN